MTDEKKIAKALATGATCVLAYGPARPVEEADSP